MRPDFVSLPNPHPYRWVSGFRVTCRCEPPGEPTFTNFSADSHLGEPTFRMWEKTQFPTRTGFGFYHSSAHCYTKLHEMLDLFEIDRIHGDARHVSYKNGESLGKHGIVFATLGESFGESHAKWVFVLLNILTMGR